MSEIAPRQISRFLVQGYAAKPLVCRRSCVRLQMSDRGSSRSGARDAPAGWQIGKNKQGALALILLFDQFPRNMFAVWPKHFQRTHSPARSPSVHRARDILKHRRSCGASIISRRRIQKIWPIRKPAFA